jgi:hypothetical protein
MARKTRKPQPELPVAPKPKSWRFTDWASL